MIDKERTKELIKVALKSVKADQIEAGIFSLERGTTRFANSIIHQNIVTENPYLWSRVILGKKIGAASTRELNPQGVERCLGKALELAKNQRPNREFKSLPKMAKSVKTRKEPEFIEPVERAKAVEKIVKVCSKYKLTAAGVIHTNRYSLGVGNSLGVFNYDRLADTTVTITAMSDTSSGFTTEIAEDFYSLDWTGLAEKASEKALLSQNPVELDPGQYTVLLEEPAVSEIIAFLAWLEFGAKNFSEKRSIISKKIGRRITGENVTILDDPFHPKTIGFPFDYEGVNKAKVVFIKDGIGKGVVFDSFYAQKLGKKNTGHALPQPSTYGPLPSNIVIAPGKTPKAQMIEAVEKGILVTRFWYTRVVDPDKTLITGMTRDGTFLVENGKITKGLKNLRFQIEIYNTLKSVRMISRETRLCGEYLSVVAPALLIDNFNFSSKTEY